ncbi:tRNA(Ile)-lysidine synthase [Fusarium globosum]|uniref:tRNA(Ile)-lysidine synthase n=1 Tax=Fusarium globosum TaxID=78864 RepID=A0A8H5XLQ0_9HYPO|nr:tRNA(Ile)-lysidine synthase [Fusarium globosum]
MTPKAFTAAGVYFDPIVRGTSIRWLLSRAPYTSTQPLPVAKLYLPPSYLSPSLNTEEEFTDAPEAFSHKGWARCKLFDGRFWIRIGRNRWPMWQVHPFRAEYAKAFRKALPPLRKARLEKLLKQYAPGKIRYTLPAIYGVERKRDPYSQHISTTLTLLALPTLGIRVPGLERWVKYDERYSKFSLCLMATYDTGSHLSPIAFCKCWWAGALAYICLPVPNFLYPRVPELPSRLGGSSLPAAAREPRPGGDFFVRVRG